MSKNAKHHAHDAWPIEECRQVLQDLRSDIRVTKLNGAPTSVYLTEHAHHMLQLNPFLLTQKIEGFEQKAMQEKYGESAARYTHKLDVQLLRECYLTQGAQHILEGLEPISEPVRTLTAQR